MIKDDIPLIQAFNQDIKNIGGLATNFQKNPNLILEWTNLKDFHTLRTKVSLLETAQQIVGNNLADRIQIRKIISLEGDNEKAASLLEWLIIKDNNTKKLVEQLTGNTDNAPEALLTILKDKKYIQNKVVLSDITFSNKSVEKCLEFTLKRFDEPTKSYTYAFLNDYDNAFLNDYTNTYILENKVFKFCTQKNIVLKKMEQKFPNISKTILEKVSNKELDNIKLFLKNDQLIRVVKTSPYADVFLDDLVKRLGNDKSGNPRRALGQVLDILDEDLFKRWHTFMDEGMTKMGNEGEGVLARVDYDNYLKPYPKPAEKFKIDARTQMANDLAAFKGYTDAGMVACASYIKRASNINGNFKKILNARAPQFSSSVDFLAESITSLSSSQTLNTSQIKEFYEGQFKRFIEKIKGEPDALDRFPDELKAYFGSNWTAKSVDDIYNDVIKNFKTWDEFYDYLVQQVHHIFPVDLFDKSEAFKIYMEFYNGVNKLDFNAEKDFSNAVMLMARKNINTGTLGVHTNHEYYTTALGAFLDAKMESYIKELKINGVVDLSSLLNKITDKTELNKYLIKIAEDIHQDVATVSKVVKNELIEKSLKNDINVNDIFIKEIGNEKESIIKLLDKYGIDSGLN